MGVEGTVRLTIAELARSTGLTARTLRYYDELGLLTPAGTTSSGMRWYGTEEVLRLQRVLVYRHLRVPLEQIGRILADEIDARAALQQQRDALVLEHRQLAEVIGSVDRALHSLDEGGDPLMTAEEASDLFHGFDTTAITAEAQQRWTAQADQSRNAAAAMTDEQRHQAQLDHEARLRSLGALADSGASPTDPRAQRVVSEMYTALTSLWNPDRQAFVQVGEQLADQPDSRAMLERITPALPDFLRQSYTAYAEARL